ncbi:MAG TPA: tetratricopeptide repeat protein [Pyrinomonadaceae bacterium]|jgi:tetratricopeptide (TPR) repeat protein/TolB-like protein
MPRRFAAALFALLAVCAALAPARARAQAVSDVVLILPFENTSGNREANWVGESFADQLAELLSTHGLRVVSSDARELTYQRLRLPLTVIPSRATAIKLAKEAGATMVVLGNYEVTPKDEKTVAEVRGSARVVRVNEGRIAGKQMTDGRWATHEFFFGDALVNLQTVQGKLAYQILYEQDDKLPFSQNLIVEQATKVPPRAFEAYVKGAMLPNGHADKPAFLQNAMREYERANPGSVYKQAAFELGQLFYSQSDYKKAAEHFTLLQRRDPHYAEAAFYAALAFWRVGELQSALDTLLPLTTDVPLTSIYNNAGAIATQAAMKEKNAQKREALLKQATNFLGRAAESAPEDTQDGAMVRYNYAYALSHAGRYQEAAEQLRAVVKENPRDPEALFLFAKMLERSGQPEAAVANDNEARKLFPGYGKAQIEWEQSKAVTVLPVHLRGDFNRAEFVRAERDEDDKASRPAPGTTAEDFLAKARELYGAGRDDEALMELRNVVRVEPMNAEAYLITGRIYMRRGELAPAISQLKASIFWDTEHRLIDAHILLGRIFLERGDRAQATAYAQSAIQIDPNNQEAIALQRELQVGIK